MINKVILIGYAGADPEVRSLESGIKMAKLRVATTERFYNSATGQRREHTEWHSITLWRGEADFADRFVKKGSQVYVEGRIRTREYTNSQTGEQKSIVEIQGDIIRTLGRRPTSAEDEAEGERESNHDREFESENNGGAAINENGKEKTERIPNPDNLPF